MMHIGGKLSIAVLLCCYKRSSEDTNAALEDPYVCTNPALFGKSFLHLWRNLTILGRSFPICGRTLPVCSASCTANTFQKNVSNVGVIFFAAYHKAY